MNTPLIIYDGACDKFTVETQNWQCNQVGNTKKKEKHTGKRERGVCYWKVLEETTRDVQILGQGIIMSGHSSLSRKLLFGTHTTSSQLFWSEKYLAMAVLEMMKP